MWIIHVDDLEVRPQYTTPSVDLQALVRSPYLDSLAHMHYRARAIGVKYLSVSDFLPGDGREGRRSPTELEVMRRLRPEQELSAL